MGKLDNLTKQYISRNHVFADICNFYLYDGKPIIQPEELHSLDSKEFSILEQKQSNKKSASQQINKHRDILKYLSAKATDNAAYLIIGIENQSDIHYAMPVRNMLYDALQYDRQLQDITQKHRNNHTDMNFTSGFQKEDKLIPVITLVVYFGNKPWDGPLHLHEMMDINDPILLQYVADYSLQLIDPHHMSDEALEKFKTDAREVFTFIKYARDKTKILELVEDNRYQALDYLTAEVINTCTNSNLPLTANKEDDVNMCQAIDEIREDSRNEGRNEGISIGRNEGITIGITKSHREMAIALLKEKVFTNEKIATLTKLSVDEINQLQQDLLQNA